MSTGKILITGATGDTGGYAIEQLLQKGHQVRALVHRIDDRSKRLEDKGVEAVAGDYLDLDAMRTAVKGVRRAWLTWPGAGDRLDALLCCNSSTVTCW
jgi:NAD(P)H dehydrogenase (quinone)